MTTTVASPNLEAACLRGHWLFGCVRQFQRDPLGVLTQVNRDHGHYARIRVLPGLYVCLLTHPDAAEHILQKNQRNYRKPERLFTRPTSRLLGNGLLTSEGEFWLTQRRLMQPVFHRQHLAKLVPVMAACAEAYVRERVAASAPVVDMLGEMRELALHIAGMTLFSTDITGAADGIRRAYQVGFEYIGRRTRSPAFLPTWVPTPGNVAFTRARSRLDRVMLGLIATRRQAASEPHDLLSLLLAARDEETGAGMSDRQVKDEALTLLAAGHETVATALAWTWYLVSQHPEVQSDMHGEIRGRLQGRSPTFEDLAALPLTRAVFEESMRLYPPVVGLGREALGPDEIDGFPIRARSVIAMSQFITHRHPDFWEEPEKFKPERFLPGAGAGRHKFAYFPFGGGPRVCIGNTFALLEGTLVLATVLGRFRVDPAPDQRVVPDATFTLRPKFGVKVVLRPRDQTGM
jgi:cytochrome P450